MENGFYLSDLVEIRQTEKMGKGVFALEYLPEGLLLELSPVIVMSQRERVLLDQTLLHDYIFIWGEREDQCAMALGYVPLYNHAPVSNCEYVMDFEKATISIITVRPIAKGEELFVNYNGDWNDERPVWFDSLSP
jgi:SET domain-containing protein